MAEEQRAQHGAGEIGAACESNLLRGEMQPRAGLQRRCNGACERDFQPVENPGDAQRHHHETVEATERQPVETCRHIRSGALGEIDAGHWVR